jgi:hypothetical protein
MNTKKYFCDEWELSSVRTPETDDRVNYFIGKFKKFEDFLGVLGLPITEINLIPSDYGVYIHIEFKKDDYVNFRDEVGVISAYLKAHLPMRNYEDVIHPKYSDQVKSYHLDYELDLNDFESSYPSHDYFYMGVFS